MRTLEMFIGLSASLIALYLLLSQGSSGVFTSLATGAGTIIGRLQGK